MFTKRCLGFFLFYLDFELLIRILKACNFFQITPDLNKILKNPEYAPFCRHCLVENVGKFQPKIFNSMIVGAHFWELSGKK